MRTVNAFLKLVGVGTVLLLCVYPMLAYHVAYHVFPDYLLEVRKNGEIMPIAPYAISAILLYIPMVLFAIACFRGVKEDCK